MRLGRTSTSGTRAGGLFQSFALWADLLAGNLFLELTVIGSTRVDPIEVLPFTFLNYRQQDRGPSACEVLNRTAGLYPEIVWSRRGGEVGERGLVL